jgi:carbamoyl-phosphate synthase large subunit
MGAIMQHIEQAGIHSGDSACSLPPYSLPMEAQNLIRKQVADMALELNVIGLMNVQMAWQDEKLYIIEVNPRASRTVPFVSKAIGRSLAKIGTQVMTGKMLSEIGFTEEIIPNYYSVKEAVMPFNKFHGVDPVLSPEMKSTGEVMGTGTTFAEAFAKAAIGAGAVIPKEGKVIISVKNKDKEAALHMAKGLSKLGFEVVATKGTAKFFTENGLPTAAVNKVKEGRPHLVDLIKNDEVAYVMNTTEGRQSLVDSAEIRKGALQHKVYYTTTLAGAEASVLAMQLEQETSVNRLQDLHAGA